MLNATNDELRLELDRTDSIGSVTLEYRVTNLIARPIFLLNILHEEINEAGIFPLHLGAYVELEEGSVIASRKLFPIPELTFVEKRNIPFVTRLLPGVTFRETLILDLPLRPNNPYVEPDPSQPFELEQRPLFFEIGYFIGVEGTENLGHSFPTDRGSSMGFDVFTEETQKLQRVGPSGSVQVVAPTGNERGTWQHPAEDQWAGYGQSQNSNA